MADKKITIYTRTTCAYCPMVKRYLKLKGISFDEINIDDNKDIEDMVVRKSGIVSVPVIVKNDWEDFTFGWNPRELGKLIS